MLPASDDIQGPCEERKTAGHCLATYCESDPVKTRRLLFPLFRPPVATRIPPRLILVQVEVRHRHGTMWKQTHEHVPMIYRMTEAAHAAVLRRHANRVANRQGDVLSASRSSLVVRRHLNSPRSRVAMAYLDDFSIQPGTDVRWWHIESAKVFERNAPANRPSTGSVSNSERRTLTPFAALPRSQKRDEGSKLSPARILERSSVTATSSRPVDSDSACRSTSDVRVFAEYLATG